MLQSGKNFLNQKKYQKIYQKLLQMFTKTKDGFLGVISLEQEGFMII